MNRTVALIVWQTACVWLPLPSCSAAAERVIAKAPVRIVTSADASIFPESWRNSPIAASGEVLPDDQVERVRTVLARALKKYPAKVLQTHLKTVYVLAELRYSGVSTSGTNSRNSVYLKVGDDRQGFTEAHLESVFHAEFSSILLRNEKRRFDAEAWRAVNPPGFQYLGHGVEAIKQNKAGLELRESLHELGFFKEYSQSTLENDFNAFAALLFMGDRTRWAVVDGFPKIRRKADLAIAFFQTIDATFTEEYFRSLTPP